MNTILDLLGSYVIGGLVLLGLVGLVLGISYTSQKNSLTEINQRSLSNIGEIITFDVNRLGYRVSGGNKVLKLTNNSLSFLSDIDNNGVVDTVEYYIKSIGGANNFFRRIGLPQNNSWSQVVKSFKVSAYDSTGTQTANLGKIKSILVEMSMSDDSVTDENISSAWSRKFYPKNL